MSWFDGLPVNSSPPDCVLYIGAGKCVEIEQILSFQPSRVVLVEADPANITTLEMLAQQHQEVTLIEAAVSGSGDQCPMNIFNARNFSSLCEPDELLELMPGLKLVTRIDVSNVAISDLLERCAIVSGDNWLIIDTPCLAGEMLTALEASGKLHFFSTLFVRLASEGLFKGCSPYQETLDWLAELGFSRQLNADTTDADFPRFAIGVDTQGLRVRELEQRIVELQAQFEATLSSERQRADEARVAQEGLESRLAQKEQLLADKEAMVVTLESSLTNLETTLSSERQRADEAQLAQEGLESRLAEKVQALEENSRDLSIALKLQLLRESDLNELQQRYGDAVKVRDEQAKLLNLVKKRLAAAADFLRSQEGIESGIDPSDVRNQIYRALKGIAAERAEK